MIEIISIVLAVVILVVAVIIRLWMESPEKLNWNRRKNHDKR